MNTTVEDCVAACQDKGYRFAGVEYASECCTSIAHARFLALDIDNR
jgi:hypothetical protein